MVRAINDEPDYTKARNYWRWLKGKLTKEGIQLVSAIHQFKFEAPYGKRLTEPALTPKIDDREMFMKGIDYSYYYEQDD